MGGDNPWHHPSIITVSLRGGSLGLMENKKGPDPTPPAPWVTLSSEEAASSPSSHTER